MSRVVVAGGSGLVGRRLLARLAAQGDEVVLLSRRTRVEGLPAGVRTAPWEDLDQVLPGAAAVVNLAGEGIAERRWTPARKALLLASRVDTTARIVAALGRAEPRPPVLVNASAIGIYDPRAPAPVDEDSPAGDGFLPEVCRAWEAAAEAATALGTRVVRLRIGVVLAREGGALPKMAAPVRAFLGAPLGHGRQGVSWIHIDDLVDLVLQALRDPAWVGAVNATAPEPLANAAFTALLGRVLHRPVLPVPGWLTAAAVRAVAGEVADALLLAGPFVLPRRAQAQGFPFRYPGAEAALADLLRPPRR